MNYLAHLHLSFYKEEILIGNFLSDMLSLSDIKALPDRFQKGVSLHKLIDSYTDTHPEVKNTTKIFHKSLGKYAPVAVDILYDFVLAKKWSYYNDQDLNSFNTESYRIIQKHIHIVPPLTAGMIQKMISDNFLLKYTHDEGLKFVFEKMNRRARFKVDFNDALPIFYKHYEEIENYFTAFYNELISECKSLLNE
jgi:acyl carrier protein phosphodiesterase